MGKITVLLSERDEERYAAYCREQGFKKSTLICRLIREHLDREGFAAQSSFLQPESERTRRGTE
jgi:hypothetical protein